MGESDRKSRTIGLRVLLNVYAFPIDYYNIRKTVSSSMGMVVVVFLFFFWLFDK